MKKQYAVISVLIAIEQLIKLFIWNFHADKQFSIISGILYFQPMQNKSLNWLASMAGVRMPVIGMIILQAGAIVVLILFYRYQRYNSQKTDRWLDMGLCAGAAGIVCSFIDVVFWGGSLDYVGVLNWFIFDLKDVYLHMCWIGLAIWAFGEDKAGKNNPYIGVSVKEWILDGCKLEKNSVKR